MDPDDRHGDRRRLLADAGNPEVVRLADHAEILDDPRLHIRHLRDCRTL